jgi:hypothetical protein
MEPIPHNLPRLMPRRLLILLTLVCVAATVLPAPGAAAPPSGTAAQAISDCNDHAQLTRYYSPTVLREALASMPADVKEYTDCYDVIERQLFSELSKGTTPGAATPKSSSSGSFLPTWLIVVIVLLALAAVTLGAVSIRRRRAVAPGPEGPSRPGQPAGTSAQPGGTSAQPGRTSAQPGGTSAQPGGTSADRPGAAGGAGETPGGSGTPTAGPGDPPAGGPSGRPPT